MTRDVLMYLIIYLYIIFYNWSFDAFSDYHEHQIDSIDTRTFIT